jgi:hypothetical protein
MLPRKQAPFAAAFVREREGKTSNTNTFNELQFAKEWKDLPCPGILRRFCSMTMWGTDKMIVVGGRDQECQILDSVEVYDFSRCEWTFLPPLNHHREEGVAIVVETKLYVFGGFGKGSYLSDCEVLDLCRPEEGFVRLRNDLPQPLKGAVAVSNGHWIYIVGGYNATVGHLNTVFALDTHTLEWDSTFPSLRKERYLPAVTVFGDTLVVAGGRSLGSRGGFKHLRSVECINLVNGTRWNYMAPMISSRSGAAAFVLDGNIYLIGGEVRNDHPASTLMHFDGTRWSQKPFRSMIGSCPGTLLVSVSRMTIVSIDKNSWDLKCLSCTSVQESDAFLKFDYKKLQRLEYGLKSQPSIERVHAFMRLFQLAMEWDEEHHGSHQHGKIAIQIRKLLTQPHITKILNEEGVRANSTVAPMPEENDFFISDDDDEKEKDDDDEVQHRPDGLVPDEIDVSSHCFDDDPSAMTLLDDCIEDPVDLSTGNCKLESVPTGSIKSPDTIRPQAVSPDHGKGKASTIVDSTYEDPVEVSFRVVSPDRGNDKVSKTAGGNAKAAAMLHPVVRPDQGKIKASKTPVIPIKPPVKEPPRFVNKDQGRGNASKIADGDTVATSESSFLGRQSRVIISKASKRKLSSRPAIPLRAVQAICDDDSSTEGLWV